MIQLKQPKKQNKWKNKSSLEKVVIGCHAFRSTVQLAFIWKPFHPHEKLWNAYQMVNTHSTSTIYIYKYECVAVTEDAPNFPYVHHPQYKRISVIVLIMVGKIWKISCIRLLHDHCTHHLNRDDDTQAPFGIYMQFLSMLLEPKKEVQHRILKGKISELGHVVKVRLSCIFFFLLLIILSCVASIHLTSTNAFKFGGKNVIFSILWEFSFWFVYVRKFSISLSFAFTASM